jgi:hypothetical protein
MLSSKRWTISRSVKLCARGDDEALRFRLRRFSGDGVEGRLERPSAPPASFPSACPVTAAAMFTTLTPMHGTKLDLRIWICAMFLVLTSSKGISSVVMARLLGVNQKTAWKMGHAKERKPSSRAGRQDYLLLAPVFRLIYYPQEL